MVSRDARASDLEVRGTPDHSLPQSDRQNVFKEHYNGGEKHIASQRNDASDNRHLTEAEESSHGQHRSRMSTPMLVLLTAAITAIIVGAAVGGGLGSKLAQKRSHPSTPTTKTVTVTATGTASAQTTTGGLVLDYRTINVDRIYNVALDCPHIDGTTYSTVSNGQTFSISCHGAFEGPTILTMLALSIYTCIEACDSFNAEQGNDTACRFAEFHATLGPDAGLPAQYNNCYLLYANATAAHIGQDSLENRGLAASAQLFSQVG